MSKLAKWDDKIWNFFASVDLAVALFIIISIASAIGTIIPQQTEPEEVIRFFSKFFSTNFASKAYEIVNLFDLNNLYNSWWFNFLLFMFALNLIVCSIDRLPSILKSYKLPPKPLLNNVLEKMPLKRDLKLSDKREILDEVIDIFKKKGFTVNTFQLNEGIQLQVKKWTKTRLAVYLTHLSILIILAGAIIGAFFGFRGQMNIVEGTALDFAISDGGKPIPLGFQIICDKFEVEYYENKGIPKAYRSYLRIVENDQTVKLEEKENIIIEVNQPFTYKGISFYQASYGFQPTAHAEFRFTFIDKSNNTFPIKARFEEKFKIPDKSVTASVVDFATALGIDEEGRLFNMTTEMINPAVLVEFEENNKKTHQWILKKIPETWETPYGQLIFNELWGAHFTGLQIRKDPGVPLIYIGSILLCVGVFISLLLRPINYFVTIKENNITYYSPSLKGKVIIEKQLDDIINKLKGGKS